MEKTHTIHRKQPAGLQEAKAAAAAVAQSARYDQFVELVRKKYPWRFEKLSPSVLKRDYLRVVDHHLEHLIPRAGRYIQSGNCRVLDFGCGSGGSAIALALAYPNVTCVGTDIDPDEVAMAQERAELYGVADRCQFHCVEPSRRLPFRDRDFDFCLCSSVLEYAMDDVRQFCVREMARLLRQGGLLFCSVPNRLYPFEIHTRKWGWNYFPKLLNARTVDCTAWEVKRLARPCALKLYRTPLIDLFRPWSAFCLRREA